MMTIPSEARGNRLLVFDWHRAARIIREHGALTAFAGLAEDRESEDVILSDGQPAAKRAAYLASWWATPVLRLDDETIDCWVWPDSARAILAGEKPDD